MTKRVVQAIVSVAIVVGIFAFAIPKIADYSAVADTLADLSLIEIATLVAATVGNLITYWLQNMSALPGLGFWPAAVVTQTTTSIANTLPAGGAVAVGLTYSMLRSWGFDGKDVALYVGVTGIWNVFMKLGLPILALAALAIAGEATGPLIVASLIGLGVLAIAIASFALVLWKSSFARRIGERLGRMVSWLRGLFERPRVSTWGTRPWSSGPARSRSSASDGSR